MSSLSFHTLNAQGLHIYLSLDTAVSSLSRNAFLGFIFSIYSRPGMFHVNQGILLSTLFVIPIKGIYFPGAAVYQENAHSAL